MNEEFAKKLLDRNRVGALLRIFANSTDIVDYQIESGVAAAKKLLDLEIGGKKVFARVDFLVSNDQRYEDSDCTEITQKLRDVADKELNDTRVSVLDIKQGDIFCMLLNYGVANHLEDRIPYSFVITHAAHEYITETNIQNMLGAMYQKARVSGLAIHPLTESVLEGRIVNSFAVWHNKSLMTVGGFDLRSSKPLKEIDCDTVTGLCTTADSAFNNTSLEYHVAGCEVIISMVRMIKNFGPCIKPVMPEDTHIAWGADEKTDSSLYKRNQAKFATKDQRQAHFASLEGVDLDYIKSGILDI